MHGKVFRKREKQFLQKTNSYLSCVRFMDGLLYTRYQIFLREEF